MMNKDEDEEEEEQELNISNKSMKTMMYTPNDVMVEILSRLPTKTVLRFRLVCKCWLNLIKDPKFAYLQLKNHRPKNPSLMLSKISSYNDLHGILELQSYNIIMDDIDHIASGCLKKSSKTVLKATDPSLESFYNFKILGSCNGLVCIGVSSNYDHYTHKFFVWNPCTKEYKKIICPLNKKQDYNHRYYGFGYDRTIDDYKLIINTARGYDHYNPDIYVEVYTLGTSSWKALAKSRPFRYVFPWCDRNGFHVNGKLYWMTRTKFTSCVMIVYFDIANEEYKQIELPELPGMHNDNFLRVRLGESKGCLRVITFSLLFTCANFAQVWTVKHNDNVNMKKEEEEEYTWDKLYTISWDKMCTIYLWEYRSFLSLKPVRFCENGEVVMVMEWKHLVLYDPKSDKFRYLREFDYEWGNFEDYTESLVSLNSGTCMGQEQPQTIEETKEDK